MNEYKINTDIISTTGITIDTRNIPMSTGKVIINNVEVTDIDSWNKAISTFNELQDKINNLQSKIDKAIELKHNWQNIKENATIVFDNNSLIEFMNNLENILKEDK